MRRVVGRITQDQVIGLARSVLALGTAGTLAFNTSNVLAGDQDAICTGIVRGGAFCVLPLSPDTTRKLLVGMLLVVALGWKPRLTAIIHWWATTSLLWIAVAADGGDQVSTVLTLLLIPLGLMDHRQWHWARSSREPSRHRMEVLKGSTIFIIQLQVAFIYFHAAVAKFGVPEWANGTAMYYWFNHPLFSVPSWVVTVSKYSVPVVALTWGTLLLELSLAAALVLPARLRPSLLGLGLLFHAAIAALFGLISFSFAMTGALLLYIGTAITRITPVSVFQHQMSQTNSTEAQEPLIDEASTLSRIPT